MKEIAKIVFSEPIMNSVLNNKPLNQMFFSQYNMNSESTINRRLQTAKSWVNYFKNLFEE